MRIHRPVGRWLGVVARMHQMYMARQLEPMGIGMGQYPFLLSICETPGIRQDNLADALYLNKSSVARALTQLEQNGFLTRTVDPADRRAYCIHPTRRAREIRGEIVRLSRESVSHLTRALSEEEQNIFASLLERVYLSCTEMPPPTPDADTKAPGIGSPLNTIKGDFHE